jgi:hypothetical protein
MKNKKKNLRQQHIWFSLWNAKPHTQRTKEDEIYYPTRISDK